MKKSFARLGIVFSLLFGLVCACSDLRFQSPESIAAIDGVTVSTLAETEADRLPTISKLPVQDCTQTEASKTCIIEPNQALKWGWGLCANSHVMRRFNVLFAQVKLMVDNVRIPDDLIFQRDETYERTEMAYCHVWLIKLDSWQKGSIIQLENSGKTSPFSVQNNNTFVMQVK